MRIRRLDLLRHGHFTGRHLEFERRPVDLHLILGANEAGKSTARAAISDFLFGFDARSPLGFRHGYPQLLVGAVLESGERRFEARRRKGNKDTLVREDGVALEGAESRLGQLLGGMDRAGFERMFSLDQQRLREGGNEMLREQGNAARTLFAASAGLGTLRTTIEALDREADSLWGPRRAAHRQFTAAHQRLQQAQQRIREHTLGAAQWSALRDAVDDAQRRIDALATAIAESETTRRRLSRIRRVRSAVLRLEASIAERAALGHVAALPAGARAEFDEACVAMRAADGALRELDADMASRRERLAGLTLDEDVLREEDTITDLMARRGAIVKARADLPTLQRQLGQLHDAIARRARELHWAAADADTLASRAPSRADIAEARDALEARGKWSDLRDTALRELRDAGDAIDRTRREREALGGVEDTTSLEGRLSAARRAGDPDERIANLDRGILEGQRRLERGLRDLQPPVAAVGQWLSMTVPNPGEVRAAAEAAAMLAREIEAGDRARLAAEADLARSRAELERAAGNSQVVSREQLETARAHRDAGWTLVEQQHISGPAPDSATVRHYAGGDPAGLAAAYRRAVERADALADRRFDGAEAAGRLAELARGLQARETDLALLLDQSAALQRREQDTRAAWEALWQPSGLRPRAPEVMLDWLQARAAAQEAAAVLESSVAQREAERAARQELRDGLIATLGTHGVRVDALAGGTLRPVVDAAEAWVSEARRRNGSRERLDTELARADALRRRRVGQLDELDADGARWLERWSPLAARLGLDTLAAPGLLVEQAGTTLRTRLVLLDELREDAERARALRTDRIEKIERDLALFSADVDRVVHALDTALAGLAPEDAAARLGERLAAARRGVQQRESLEADLQSQGSRRASRADERAGHAARIEALMTLVGESTLEALANAISRWERFRKLESDIEELRGELARQGDGLGEEELARECAGVDLDAAAVREQATEQQLKDLNGEYAEARDALMEARRRLAEAMGGTDINEAHAALNAAAAELGGIAGSYLRVNTARQLLRWALERYRREQQGPLLKRAGELFARLTGGSFESLGIGYDERDEARILARRHGGEAVGVDGLSEGSRDQLFLALRIASVEHQLESSAEPLPFVADDLFVNFDDARTRAGLQVLAELATRTQVLVFTHHAHLLALAREEAPDAVGIVEL